MWIFATAILHYTAGNSALEICCKATLKLWRGEYGSRRESTGVLQPYQPAICSSTGTQFVTVQQCANYALYLLVPPPI